MVDLNNWEFYYNGLTFGGFQAIQLSTVEGLNPPDIRVDAEDKMEDHGGFVFANFLSTRTVTFTGDLAGDVDSGEFEILMTNLRKAFAPQSNGLPLSYRLGIDDVRYINAKPTRVFYNVDPIFSTGYAQFSIQLMAEDPRIYSDTEQSLQLFPQVLAGMHFDVAFDITFGGGFGGLGTATNLGSFPTPVVFTITGPATNPVIVNSTVGAQIKLNTVLASTETMVIDTAARTVMLNGDSSRYRTLDPSSQWFDLIPGDNQLQFFADSTNTSTLLGVRWHDAWQ